jgi:hypothetical protein
MTPREFISKVSAEILLDVGTSKSSVDGRQIDQLSVGNANQHFLLITLDLQTVDHFRLWALLKVRRR